MKKILLILFFIPLLLTAQTNKYFIRFTDKNSSPFSVGNPTQFLSPRAISRRQAQNILITDEDLPVNPSYVAGLQNTGAIVFTKSKWFNGATIECDSTILSAVLALPFVQSSEKVMRKKNSIIGNKFSSGVPLNNSTYRVSSFNYGDSYNQIHLMNGEYLHDAGYTGTGMLIALLDAGFYAVDQLAPFDSMRSRILATWDFVENDSNVYDAASHGMNCLSTIAGYVPGELVGTAPNASFLLLRSEDANTENIIEEYNWNSAAEYADSAGADVISSSLGYTTFDDSTMNHSYADMDGNHCPSSIAADKAASKGMLVITSAGNSGSSGWHYISAPTDGDSVLSIAAVDSSGFHASFSSYGPSSDGDVKPNVAAKGLSSTICDAGGSISTGSGTSFACPILAGSATCLWQAFPSMSANQIKGAIERSGNYFNAPNDSLGYGIPDFRVASFFLSTGGNFPVEDKLIAVYPNPFTDNLNVSFYSSMSQKINIELFNSIGQVIYSESKKVTSNFINTFSLNTNQILSPGFYILRVGSDSESFDSRVVKQ